MAPPWPARPSTVRSRNWPVIAPALLATVVAVAALIVSLTMTGTSTHPNYTTAEKAAAKVQLCDQYKFESHALNIETDPKGDPAFARISMVNGALILQAAASNPALDPKYRDAALILASSYLTMAAKATTGITTPEGFREAVADSNAKEILLNDWCNS